MQIATTATLLLTAVTVVTMDGGFRCSRASHHADGGAAGTGGSEGGGCAALTVVDAAVSLDGYTRFSPDEKRNNPSAGDPSYVFLAAGSEAVVIPGPDVTSQPGLFALDHPSIALVGDAGSGANGYAVTVNGRLGYRVTIADFEAEVSLARVELCEANGAIDGNFVFTGNAGAGGVAHAITIAAVVDGVTSPPATPVTVEVR